MTDALEADLCTVLDWAEEEPSIYVIIVTGTSVFRDYRIDSKLILNARQGREIVYSALDKISKAG